MGKPRPSPTVVLTALSKALAALEVVATAWGDPDVSDYDSCEGLLDASEEYARALLRLQELARVDRRFDFGAITQAMLEFLPRLVVHGDGDVLTELALSTAITQLHDVASAILDLTRPHPKPLDIPGFVPADKET